MEHIEICDKYPKYPFGSELTPEKFLVTMHSSKDVIQSSAPVFEALNTYGIALVEFTAEESPRQQLLCFAQLFGNTMHHDRSDADDIAVVAVLDETSVYPGISSRAYTFHTDGSYDEDPPEVVALRCEIPARKGGVTQLASARKLYEWLHSVDKIALNALHQEDAISIRRAGKSFSGAIFRKCLGSRRAIRYRADEAVSSSTHPNVKRAIDLVQTFLSNAENLVSFPLKAKQVLLTDNFSVLHGRTAFDSNDPRKLHRLWFNGKTSSSGLQLCSGFEVSE